MSSPDGFSIRVVPPTVPTTASPFHPSATHVDALGMPVAFTTVYPDGGEPWPYHPTPCCGATASISDGPMYCKACYADVDFAFGNAPLEPFRTIAEAQGVTPLDSTASTAPPTDGASREENDMQGSAPDSRRAKGEPTTRTILVHLNIEVPASCSLDADQVAEAVKSAYDVGFDHPALDGFEIVVALAEEI